MTMALAKLGLVYCSIEKICIHQLESVYNTPYLDRDMYFFETDVILLLKKYR